MWTREDGDRPHGGGVDAAVAAAQPRSPAAAIDFSKQMIVGVFMGSRNSAGFAVEIVSAPDADGVITVHYAKRSRREAPSPPR